MKLVFLELSQFAGRQPSKSTVLSSYEYCDSHVGTLYLADGK